MLEQSPTLSSTDGIFVGIRVLILECKIIFLRYHLSNVPIDNNKHINNNSILTTAGIFSYGFSQLTGVSSPQTTVEYKVTQYKHTTSHVVTAANHVTSQRSSYICCDFRYVLLMLTSFIYSLIKTINSALL